MFFPMDRLLSGLTPAMGLMKGPPGP